jgi:hypothetical protein
MSLEILESSLPGETERGFAETQPRKGYPSHKVTRQREQVRRRKSLLAESKKPRPRSRQIIATLLELIKDPRAERDQIVLRCQRSGVAISRELVNVIFEAYDLDKKRAL